MDISQEREGAFGRRHYHELDGIRGVLALGVVLLHFGINNQIERLTGWPGMTLSLAVDVFFLLSGFVLAKSYGGDVRQFAVKRIWRLAPVYFATLAIVAIVAPARITSFSELLLAPPLLGIEPANFPAWSITWELYLPLLGVLLLRLRKPPWQPVLVAALLVHCILATFVPEGEVLGGARAAAGLVAGACLARAPTIRLPALPFVMAILVVMALAERWSILAALVPPLAALAILAGAHRDGFFSRRPFQFAGAISFTVYMLHAPILMTMGERAVGNIGWKIAGLAASVIGAWAMTHWIELPAMRLGRKLAGRG